MELFYHSDIITKVYGAFKCHCEDPATAHEMIETLAVHRIENSKADLKHTPAEQVIMTLYSHLMTHGKDVTKDDLQSLTGHHILCAPYQPETLEEESVKNTIMKMCSTGKFVPFMLSITKADATIDTDNVAVVVAGIGDDPDMNFAVMTLNIPEVVTGMNLQYGEDTAIDDGYIIYPALFDLPKNVLATMLPKNAIAIRTFVYRPADNEAVELEAADEDTSEQPMEDA